MRSVVALCGAAVFAGSASAQSLSPLPEVGLWEERIQLLINGKDLMAQLRQSQAAMLKNMPANQRAAMEADLKKGTSDTQRECLTKEDAAEWKDPRKALASMERESQCKFDLVSVSGSALQFKGRCKDPDGFTGDVAGNLTMAGPRAYTFSYTGKGRMAGAEGGGPVEMKMTSSARWVAARCE
jgi:hypothetical protein